MRSALVHAGIFGLLGGIVFQFAHPHAWHGAAFVALLGACAFGVSWVDASPRMRAAGVFIALAGFGMARAWWAQQDVLDSRLVENEGRGVELAGVVVSDPEQTPTGQKFRLDVDDSSEDVLVFGDMYPALVYGDRIELAGTLKAPEPFITDSGRMFDYPAFLARQNIFHIVQRAQPRIVSRGEGNAIAALFVRAKHAFVESIEDSSMEPYAGLAAGVVLGVESALSQEHEEAFRVAGLIHIIVVSGYNITMAGEAARAVFGVLSPAAGLVGSLGGIVAYIALTGASSTAVRAGIMAAIAVAGRALGRHYNVTRALLLAACVMALHTPDILLHDPSFQLSFLATWGLTSIAPIFEARLGWLTERFGIRETVTTTLGAQAAVLPLILYQSGSTHILSLLANFVVVPTMPALMALSLGSGLAGTLSRYVALPFAVGVDAIGAYVFTVVRTVNMFPDATLRVGTMSVWMVVGCYIFLVAASRRVDSNLLK